MSKRENNVLQWAFKFNSALAAAEMWHLNLTVLWLQQKCGI